MIHTFLLTTNFSIDRNQMNGEMMAVGLNRIMIYG